ncbi:hypothetical protein EHM69_05785 [candidate division KSB1 bacterium]|nr:MAG: hypothetical protein EHM69_05785 [candidate division KSB1 bacterium]
MDRHREEVLNITFAECLREAGLKASGEQIYVVYGKTALPDVLIDFRGHRCMVEGKYSDVSGARAEVLANASARVRDGISHFALAIIYPASLRTVEQNQLSGVMQSTRLQFALCFEANYEHPDWYEGGMEDVLDVMRRGFEALAEDDVLAKAVATLRSGSEVLLRVMDAYPVPAARICDILGVILPPDHSHEKEDLDDE